MKINNFQGELTDVSVVKEALAAGGDAGHRDDGQGDREGLPLSCCSHDSGNRGGDGTEVALQHVRWQPGRQRGGARGSASHR